MEFGVVGEPEFEASMISNGQEKEKKWIEIKKYVRPKES